jgi:stage V sporulation protein AE
VEIGGAGATVPLPGFGYALAKGAIKGVEEAGIIGAFTGGVTATAGGVTAAIVFGYMMSVLFNPRSKK